MSAIPVLRERGELRVALFSIIISTAVSTLAKGAAVFLIALAIRRLL